MAAGATTTLPGTGKTPSPKGTGGKTPRDRARGVITDILLAARKNRNVIVAIFVVTAILVMLIPMPPYVMDVFLGFSIMLGVVLLMMTVFVDQPLQFSTFPSLLLMLTVYRLSLNIGTTRLILSGGREKGIGAAGQLIATFGSFVGGGGMTASLDAIAVGLTLFIILMVVQYKVITEGMTRIAEVAARFTLDAMPGKQMAIDADLNSGLIDEGEARRRRSEIQQLADFYGSMDGAGKFVRGDTVAGIIITIVTISVGFVIGVAFHGMSFGEAARIYTILTIGDGLINQLPALMINVGAGLLVTRAAGRTEFGEEVIGQFFSRSKPLGMVACLIGLLGLSGFVGLTPFPWAPLFFVAGLCGGGWFLARRTTATQQAEAKAEEKAKAEAKPADAAAAEAAKDKPEALLKINAMELDIGYGIVPLVDERQTGTGSGLLGRIQMIRQQLALELGIIVPPIRIRDDPNLEPNAYVVKIQDAPVANGRAEVDRLLAIDTGAVTQKIDGEETVEPAFGMPAVWISKANKEYAETLGYMVVDAESAVATHLTEVIKRRSSELLTRDEVRRLLDVVKETAPGAVDEVVPGVLSVADVQKVLQNLLSEKISIRNLPAILEVLGDYGRRTKDTDILTEFVRYGLRRWICNEYAGPDHTLHLITLDARLEDAIQQRVEHTEGGGFLALRPQQAQKLVDAIRQEAQRQIQSGHAPLLATRPQIRLHIKRLTIAKAPSLAVISHTEIPPEFNVEQVGMVNVDLGT